jgi:hypothetical protein
MILPNRRRRYHSYLLNYSTILQSVSGTSDGAQVAVEASPKHIGNAFAQRLSVPGRHGPGR